MAGTKRPSAVLDALTDANLEDVPPPKKKRAAKKSKDVVVDPDSNIEDGPVTQPAPAPTASVSISYTMSIFTAAQMKKTNKKRGDPKTSVMQLKSDLEWDAFKAKLLVKVDSILKPELLSFDDYRVSFAVARHHPRPTELANEDTYQFMTSRALKSKDPCATITIESIIHGASSDEKENKEKSGSENSDDSESGSDKEKKKKKKKKKKKSDPSELPGNKAITREIGRLRQKWQCHSPPCGNGHCYVHPEEKTHFPLGHTHFSIWAAAIIKGDDTATLEKPPNHKVFDFAPDNAKAKLSILQRRSAAAQNQSSSSQQPIQIFNGMTPEMLNLLRPSPVTPKTSISDVVTSSASSGQPISISNSPLFSASIKPAVPIPLTDFCTAHNLSNEILKRFSDNGFTSINQLCYITLSDLKDMEFKRGEVAAIQDAIETWANSRQAN